MVVTPDVIGVIVAIFVAAITFLGGVGGLLARQSRYIEARFDKVDARFDKVDARFERLETRMDRLEAELTEVKIAIARIEGPQPRLLRP